MHESPALLTFLLIFWQVQLARLLDHFFRNDFEASLIPVYDLKNIILEFVLFTYEGQVVLNIDHVLEFRWPRVYRFVGQALYRIITLRLCLAVV